MTELESAAVVLLILLVATVAGMIIRPLLPDEHKTTETFQVVQLVLGMLVTFAALVLGLLTASAKTLFDTTTDDIRGYATQLIQLGDSLREYGAGADGARRLLRPYTAAAIASTWDEEPPPPGNYYPKKIILPDRRSGHLDSRVLGAMLEHAQRDARELQPQDAFHQKIAAEIQTQFDQLIQRRWKLVEESRGAISTPFDRILVFWLTVIFLCFGLIAPRNALSFVTLAIGAFSIASAVFGDPRSRHAVHRLDPGPEPAHARCARVPEPLNSELDGDEIVFADVAQGAAPVFRNIGETGAGSDAFFGQTVFFVVYPPANQANPAFKFYNFAHDRLICFIQRITANPGRRSTGLFSASTLYAHRRASYRNGQGRSKTVRAVRALGHVAGVCFPAAFLASRPKLLLAGRRACVHADYGRFPLGA
jgi:hypothetical protein